MRAKAFFYVCAGLFLLALSYHLGARSAAGQSAAVIEGVNVDGAITAVVDGVFKLVDPTTGTAEWTVPIPVPGPIIGTGPTGVIYGNGDIYLVDDPIGGTWILRGNLASGTVPAQRESFGAMKSRYRGEREAAQPTPQDR